MPEYALLGAVVIGIALFPLTILGSNLSRSLAFIGKPPSNQLTLTLPNADMGASQDTRLPLPESLKAHLTPIQITLSDGTLLLIHAPIETKETIATIGANGTTDLYADVIRQLGQELHKTKKIDDSGYNQFAALANQGHYIAQIEATVEQSALHAKDLSSFQTTPVVFAGHNYDNAYELTRLIGTYEQSGNIWHMGAELQKLWDLHDALEDTSALKEPAVKQLLHFAETKIDRLASATEASARNLILNGQGVPTQILSTEASLVSHEQSANICQLGNGVDFGIFCPQNKKEKYKGKKP